MKNGSKDEHASRPEGAAEAIHLSSREREEDSEWAVVRHDFGEDLPPGSDRDRLIEAIDKAFEADRAERTDPPQRSLD